jgi:hypothetical protein
VPVTLIVSNTIYLPCIAKNYCPGFPYFDDFSNPNSGWGSGDTTRRKYGYLNGEYQILIKGTDDGFWITPDLVLPGSYVIEVDARHASSATGAYGLRFGMRWDGSGKLIEFYQFLMDPLIRKYLLEKYKNGSWQTLIGWTYDSRINQYATNHLGISRIGTAIYIDVNYARLGTAYDGDFTSAGRDAGLIVLSGESAPVDFRFDNFSVTCQ